MIKRCFSFIKDDIDILTELAFSKKARSEIINIGPDDEFVTINELSNTISNLLAFNTKPILKKVDHRKFF